MDLKKPYGNIRNMCHMDLKKPYGNEGLEE